MSILKSTQSGILSMPLTPETAQALGWKIKTVDGQKDKQLGKDWKCINMEREDVCAPIQFWYEPQEKFKYCNARLCFFADSEFVSDNMTINSRYITTVKELVGYLEFLHQAQKLGNQMKALWDKYMKNLKDPNERYY